MNMKAHNHIVLLEPEIPQNTGNIARTCMATNTILHLIHPLGFSLEDKYVRRAGMDYWKDVKLEEYIDWSDFISKTASFWKAENSLYFLTTKGRRIHSNPNYSNGNNWFLLGKESAGIPTPLLKTNENNCIRIPMNTKARSLNLSNSASIILYEALRQQDYPSLLLEGKFRN